MHRCKYLSSDHRKLVSVMTVVLVTLKSEILARFFQVTSARWKTRLLCNILESVAYAVRLIVLEFYVTFLVGIASDLITQLLERSLIIE